MEKEYIKLEELREAKLIADPEVFKNIIEAHEKEDVKRFQEIHKYNKLLKVEKRIRNKGEVNKK